MNATKSASPISFRAQFRASAMPRFGSTTYLSRQGRVALLHTILAVSDASLSTTITVTSGIAVLTNLKFAIPFSNFCKSFGRLKVATQTAMCISSSPG